MSTVIKLSIAQISNMIQSRGTFDFFFLWNLFSFLISLTQKLQNTTTQNLKLSQLP